MEKAKEQAKQQVKEAPKKLPPEFRRDPQDFVLSYANNAMFETTSWDLKIVFGQTDLSIGPNVVMQHTAITLPWPYVKIFSYLLQIHVAAHEAENGHVEVPKNIVVSPSSQLTEEMASLLKHPQEGREAVERIWKEFLAANPELEK